MEIKSKIENDSQTFIFGVKEIEKLNLGEIFLEELGNKGWISEYVTGLYQKNNQSNQEFMSLEVAEWFLKLFTDESLMNVLVKLLINLQKIFKDLASSSNQFYFFTTEI